MGIISVIKEKIENTDRQVNKLDFSCPVLVIDNFLSVEENHLCLQEAIDLKPVYLPARVGFAEANRRDTSIRTNDVVHLDNVFRGAAHRSKLLTILHKTICQPEYNKLWHEGYTIFDIINYATWREMTLSRYGEGNFYQKHQDTVFSKDNNEITHRLVTICYYMNTGKFEGGELSVFDKDKSIDIQPTNNRAVIFPSFVHHAVKPAKIDGSKFENGRFSINFWLGFK